MSFVTIREMSQKWGMATRRISALCLEGRIQGAVKQNGIWKIPVDNQRPTDGRIKNDKYINRNKNKNQMASKDYQSNLKNLKGTFAIEYMKLSNDTINNIEKIANSEIAYSEIVESMKQKYMQRI